MGRFACGTRRGYAIVEGASECEAGGGSGARPRPSRCAAAHLGRGRVILVGAFGLPGRKEGWRALRYGSTAEAATRGSGRHAKPHARTQCSSGSGRQEQPHARTQCSRGAPGPLALGPLVLLVVLASPSCPCRTCAERFGGDLSSGTRRSLELGGALMEADEVREAVGEGRSAAARAELCSCAGPSFGRKGGFIQPVARRVFACNPYVRWISPKTICI